MPIRDNITELILKMNLFIAKRGQDLEVNRAVIKAINAITGEDSLDAIYINNTDNFNVPDVAVIPLYHNDFNTFAMDPNNVETCPFGYTIEIHKRCFDKFGAEELTAVVIHDILQNVESDTAKIRFMKAYNAVISKYPAEMILDSFDDLSHAEITFIMFMEICCRPFRVPVMHQDYTGTDSTLVAMGLGDAYESYLDKVLPMSDDDPEDRVNQELAKDYRDVSVIIQSCLDNDIRHYYNVIRNGVPLVTLDHIFTGNKASASVGFISRKKTFKRRYVAANGPASATSDTRALTESYFNPKNELELRFQVDKIISEMRYADTEAEREVMLYKIKNLSLKCMNTLKPINKRLEREPNNKDLLDQKETLLNFMDELDMLRKKVTEMEIKQKVWRVYSKMDCPEGYQF